MTDTLAFAPTFFKGIVVMLCAFVLFVGTVYLLLSAVFGLRMAYLVLAVSFFGWMIIFSSIWVIGQPTFGILQIRGTLSNLGPRGTEAHWQVFAAGTGPVQTKYAETVEYPGGPWEAPTPGLKSSVDSAKSAIQKYLAAQAATVFEDQGQKVCDPAEPLEENCVTIDPTTFVVEDFRFTHHGKTSLVATHAFYQVGGPELTVYAYHDSGNLQVYSWSFFAASMVLFFAHLPLLDRAEKRRKAILTGGTAPPWYGPA
jgi:hypothetical protein